MLERNRDRIEQFAVLFFNVETFWWQERFVPNTPENVAALLKFSDGLALEARTDLGQALAEGTAPAWQKPGEKTGCDFFLLSDGAATWGEDNWSVLAGKLRAASAGPLFAYNTGMSGTEGRLLAHLAEQSGGAVFSVVGEAEIDHAATAHRFRPWRLRASKRRAEATCWWRAGRRPSSPTRNCWWSAAASPIRKRRKSS